MELIRTLRQKQQASRQNSITQQAHSCICLDDFDGKIFISYNGTPLIPIDDKCSPKDILIKLEETRNSFISYRMKQLCPPKAAIL